MKNNSSGCKIKVWVIDWMNEQLMSQNVILVIT